MAQERLWITQPSRVTCLAKVIGVKGSQFAVDKALFAPRTRACRHPQNHDQGTVWWEGEKRKLSKVLDGEWVWYSLRGTVPSVGATLQCQLNQDIRQLTCRAHTAMHLFLQAVPREAMVTDPEVKGGGHFRLTFARPISPKVLAAAVQQTQAWIAADLPVTRRYVQKSEAREVRVQAFQPPDPVPGPEVLPLVTIGTDTVPCDGTHVDRTGRIQGFVVSHAAMGKAGFVVGGRVS